MKGERLQLWIAQFALAFSALTLHYKLHPPFADQQVNLTHFWAFLFCVVDLVVVSILFLSKKSAIYGLLLNSFFAFLGIIMMTDLMIVSVLEGWVKVSFWSQPVEWFLESMIPSIVTLFADFMVGLALFRATMVPPAKRP
jgi:hypothetical protein